jgi:hypothetical protein
MIDLSVFLRYYLYYIWDCNDFVRQDSFDKLFKKGTYARGPEVDKSNNNKKQTKTNG